jgi:pimeloyl-ACP methyl ester carboxylesterase
MGLKPPHGEIVDQILIAAPEYVRFGFTSEEAFKRAFPGETEEYFETWWANREMTTRLAWKPYMYDPALKHLLRSFKAPTIIGRSTHDAIVPASCADAYRAAIPHAELIEVDSGHQADLETPEAIADLVLLLQNGRALRAGLG